MREGCLRFERVVVGDVSDDCGAVGSSAVHFRKPAEAVSASNVPELDVDDLLADLEGLALEVAGDGGLGFQEEVVADEAVDEAGLAGAGLADYENFKNHLGWLIILKLKNNQQSK